MTAARVLVVDDEPDVVELIEMLLQRRGYEVLTASNGMEGIMRADAERPDLILLDIMMDEMDGWETLKLLRLEANTRDIPVVMVSARMEPRDKIRGLQEGAVDYVTKPFAVQELLDTVAEVLAARPNRVRPGEPR